MKTIEIPAGLPSQRQLDEICNTLNDGGIVIIPTDTIYGIACDALNPKAIEHLCRIKGINPEKTNLSIICKDIAQAAEYARIDNATFRMIRANTPGPFTFLLRSASSLPKAFKGRKTVGIRIPDDDVCLAITEAFGHPLLTTSIQYEDDDYAINPGLIAETYEDKVDLMVQTHDGEMIPSTIVDTLQSVPEIIRQGKGELQ